MTHAQKAALIGELEKAMVKTRNEISLLESSIQPLAQDCSLEPLTKSELMGEINMNVTLLEQAQKRFEALKSALKRSSEEDFGICESCGEDIPFERLLLIPETMQCIACLDDPKR